MKFILIANEKSRKSFFPPHEVLLFSITITLILFFLYPKNLLNKVLAQNKPAAVTLSYLKAFRMAHQQDPQFMFDLIEQEIGMGQLLLAKKDIPYFEAMNPSDKGHVYQVEWLKYILLRSKTYATKLNTPKRITYLHQLRDMLVRLSKQPLKSYQLKAIALDSLWLGEPQISLSIYKNLMTQGELTTEEDLAEGGNIATQNNAQMDSSKFYWAAYQKAKTKKNQKLYAINSIKALWAGNYVNEAVALANQLPDTLIQDRDTLLYLSHLAMAANQPEIAEKYALRALLLNAEPKHE